jgi:hypothetical protein
MPDKQEAANLMANLRIRLTKLCDALEKNIQTRLKLNNCKNFRSDPQDL